MPITEDNKADIASALREAAFHLTSCWDALREAESLSGEVIETADIGWFCGELAHPSSVHHHDSYSNDDVIEGAGLGSTTELCECGRLVADCAAGDDPDPDAQHGDAA